jgi:hemolysin III
MKKIAQNYYLHTSDERANVLTHFIGLLLCFALSSFILYHYLGKSGFGGVAMFCFGGFFMFVSSTVYHYLIHPPTKYMWRIIDHISIFILIGCSYTAYLSKYYDTEEGRLFLFIHWTIIAFGVIFKLVYKEKYEYLSLGLYLFLGWMVTLKYDSIFGHMPDVSKYSVFAGGVFYCTGVYFYVQDHKPYYHAIWHVLVLFGFAAHWFGLFAV